MRAAWFPGVIFSPLRKSESPITLLLLGLFLADRRLTEVLLMKKKFARAETITADEVSHLETLVMRFEESEKAWQRMTAPIDDADPWAQVEEHMLERRDGDSDRRWKFFSK